MEQREKRTPLDKHRWIGIAVTIASYFVIKYGIVPQYFALEETMNFVYSLGLILSCVFIGRAVEHWSRGRDEK